MTEQSAETAPAAPASPRPRRAKAAPVIFQPPEPDRPLPRQPTPAPADAESTPAEPPAVENAAQAGPVQEPTVQPPRKRAPRPRKTATSTAAVAPTPPPPAPAVPDATPATPEPAETTPIPRKRATPTRATPTRATTPSRKTPGKATSRSTTQDKPTPDPATPPGSTPREVTPERATPRSAATAKAGAPAVAPAPTPEATSAITPQPAAAAVSSADPEAASPRTPEPDLRAVAVRLRDHPGFAPELLALEAVRTLGPGAAEWARRLRDRYPDASADGLARLATRRYVRAAGVGGAAAALAGLFAPLAELVSVLWTQSNLVLHLAAAYGRNPSHPDRAEELLVLTQVHPDAASARAALAGAREAGDPVEGTWPRAAEAAWRLAAPLTAQAGGWVALRLASRLVPGAAVVAATLGDAAAADRLAARAVAAYRTSWR
ncbi:hypothetical protein [Micromonospora sp. NPDC049102]|uniref:hypothetical protein n=1 Tax=Micromonospora sp. NPDC049102 TaxID=3364265 RepID=UPI003716F428